MSVNKFRDTTIYGNFKNKDLLTSASNTTVVTPASAEFDGNVTVNGIFRTNGTDNIFDGPINCSTGHFTNDIFVDLRVDANEVNSNIGISCNGYITGNTLQSSTTITGGSLHILSDGAFDGNLTCDDVTSNSLHTNTITGTSAEFSGNITADTIQSTMLEIISNGKIRTVDQTSAPNYGNILGMSYEQIMSSSVTLTTNTVYSFTNISFSSGEYGMYQLNALVYIKSDTTSSDTTNLTSYDIYVDGCSVVPRYTGACNISTTGTKNIVIMSCPISMTLSLYTNTTITLKVNCTFTKTGSGTINIGPNSYIQLTKTA